MGFVTLLTAPSKYGFFDSCLDFDATCVKISNIEVHLSKDDDSNRKSHLHGNASLKTSAVVEMAGAPPIRFMSKTLHSTS